MAGFGAGVGYGVHTNSLENLTRGIVERVFYVSRDGGLVRPPQPSQNVFSRLNEIRSRLLSKLNSTPIVPREDYSGMYVGRKKLIYQKAWESLIVRPIHPRDAWVSTFVKAEKVNFTAKIDPAPRVIQPRSPRYNLEVGRYLKLFERELCTGFKRTFGYQVILKGLNATSTAAAMRSNWEAFDEPVAIGLDASRFDQHVSDVALKWEHSIYNGVFGSPELRKLLRWQLQNKGIARVPGYRVDYSVDGCRMSGDINTGMGNCLLMSSIVLAYCEHIKLSARLSNNGDDCVVFINKSDLPKMSGISSWMLDFGFTLTIEEPVHIFEQVVFCQAQPVLTSTGWRMVRDPRTAMSKDSVSLLGWDNESNFTAWAGAIGACGLSLTRGVPLWEAWYSRLVSIGRCPPSGVSDVIWDSGLGYMARGVEAGVITEESRYSFYLAFGILPDLQLSLEHDYSQPASLSAPSPMTIKNANTLDQLNGLTLWLTNQTPQCQS